MARDYFDIEYAKAGWPVKSTCERKVEIFKFDYPMSGCVDFPLIIGAIYKSHNNAFVTYWRHDGRWYAGGPFNAGNLIIDEREL